MDLIDLPGEETLFKKLVKRDGRLIYDKKSLIENYRAEIENIEQIIKIFRDIEDIRKLKILELAGLGVYIHNFYNGLENILKRVLLSKGIRVKEGPFWHKDLLQTVLKKGIIDDRLYKMLLDYHVFRHYFVHGYAFRLEAEKLYNLVENVEVVYKKFKEMVEAIIFNI